MVRIAPYISWHAVEGELALFDGRDGGYHALNGSAAAIWRGLAEEVPQARLAERLAAEHGVDPEPVARDIAEFVETALAKGLLVRA